MLYATLQKCSPHCQLVFGQAGWYFFAVVALCGLGTVEDSPQFAARNLHYKFIRIDGVHGL